MSGLVSALISALGASLAELGSLAAGSYLLLIVVVGVPTMLWINYATSRAYNEGVERANELASRRLELVQERADARAAEGIRIEDELRRQLDNANDTLRDLGDEYKDATAQEIELRVRLEETERSMVQRERLLRENGEQLKAQFSHLAKDVLDLQGERVAQLGQKGVDTVLLPFREQLAEFKHRVDEIHHVETKDRASLLTEVRALQVASERTTAEAANLAQALKGDKRLQGHWGEMILERLLQQSGLEAGREYSAQFTARDASGERKRPDVVVHLPDSRDVVIDSKVSLLAYERATVEATDEQARASALREHVRDLRNHVNGLASKNYDQLDGLRSLDFVLMFVPLEAALTQALNSDNKLLEDALAKRVLLVSPSTLLLSLRTIHTLWRHDKQNKNAQEIAERAGSIYDKVRLLANDFDALGRQLGAVDTLYSSARARLFEGRGNLIRQIEQVRELGARVKTPVAQELLSKTQAEHDDLADTRVGAQTDPEAEAAVEVDVTPAVRSAHSSERSEAV